MKILVYGFKPYKKFKQNITEEIAKKIKTKKIYIKVFPVKFDKQIFINQIKKIKPDVIIGLGQASRGRKIRIERRAINLKKVNGKKTARILKGKPKYYFLNLKLKKEKIFRSSYDAGKYICNFSMYIICNFTKNQDIKFGFIHISNNYNVNKAKNFILKKIKEIKREVR